jgi:membrane associated rhomboid family serine protease
VPSNGPVLLALPAFRGLTRKLILLSLIVFAVLFVLGLVAPGVGGLLSGLLTLHPDDAPRLLWQFVTWPFIPEGFLGLLFALLSLWYFGSSLEDERGSRWFGELFLVASVGGAILATFLSLTLGRVFAIIHATGKYSNGLWPVVLALLVAFAVLHPDESLSFNFIFRARAKYIAAIFLVVYLVIDYFILKRFDALNAICNVLCAWAFVKIAPRRGLRHGFSERWFGLRNAFYRAKRRRAAKKFTVYMRKQGKDVNIDTSGRYIGLDDEDPDDKHRMN